MRIVMLKKILIRLAYSILLLVAIDVALRFYLYFKYNRNKDYLSFVMTNTTKPKPETLSMYGDFRSYKGYRKYSPGTFKFGNGGTFTINSSGFRGSNFLAQKKTGQTRICIFGDSDTFGLNVSDNETYPFYMQQIFDSYHPSAFEVINCGSPASKILSIYFMFSREVIKYHPDVIIINSIFNDCFNPELKINQNFAWRIHTALYYKWMLYTLLLEKYSFSKNKNPVPFFYFSRFITPDYVNYAKLIISLAKKNNIKVMLVKQPALFSKNDVNGELTSEQLEKMYASGRDEDKRKRIAFFYYTKQIQGMADEAAGVWVAGTFKELLTRPEFFKDEMHLTPEGYAFLAKLLVDDMLKQRIVEIGK